MVLVSNLSLHLTWLHISTGISCPVFRHWNYVGSSVKVLQHQVLNIDLGQVEFVFCKGGLNYFLSSGVNHLTTYDNPMPFPLDDDSTLRANRIHVPRRSPRSASSCQWSSGEHMWAPWGQNSSCTAPWWRATSVCCFASNPSLGYPNPLVACKSALWTSLPRHCQRKKSLRPWGSRGSQDLRKS